MPPNPLISVAAPVFCEEELIEQFCARVTAVMIGLKDRYDYEIVLVDDGSTDRSPEVLRVIARQDPRVRVLFLSRNFGHQSAITAAIDHARGDGVVVMDSDLQDPPEMIPEMIEQWEKGVKVVYAVRTRRRGESAFKRTTARVFYRTISRLSDVELPQDSGDFRLLDREVVTALCQLREESRYIRGLVAWIGFSQAPVCYERDERLAGETKFTFRKMVAFASDGLTGFTEKPLRISMKLGAATTLLALTLLAWIAIERIFAPERVVEGWTSLAIAVLFLGGVQLLSIGILGEYIGKIYREVKGRPLYVLKQDDTTDLGDE